MRKPRETEMPRPPEGAPRLTHCTICGRKLSDSNMSGQCRSHWTPEGNGEHRTVGRTHGGQHHKHEED